MDDDELVRELVDAFLDDTPEQMSALEAGVRAGRHPPDREAGAPRQGCGGQPERLPAAAGRVTPSSSSLARATAKKRRTLVPLMGAEFLRAEAGDAGQSRVLTPYGTAEQRSPVGYALGQQQRLVAAAQALRTGEALRRQPPPHVRRLPCPRGRRTARPGPARAAAASDRRATPCARRAPSAACVTAGEVHVRRQVALCPASRSHAGRTGPSVTGAGTHRAGGGA